MGKEIDLTGHRYGRLLVEHREPPHITPGGRKLYMWACLCECGNRVTVTTNNLRRGNTKSCGCYRDDALAKELTGERFGRLVVVSRNGSSKRGDAMWLCKCDCGTQKTIIRSALVSGRTKSCGCLQRDAGAERGRSMASHGMSGTRIYRIWCGMKSRTCETADARHKRDYYDRGIRICKEWEHSFESFREWAEKNGYTDSLTIDRIDNDGDYEHSNCRWISNGEQSLNRRSNVVVSYNGATKTVSQWAIDAGLPYDVLRDRITRYGWTAERAITTPIKR